MNNPSDPRAQGPGGPGGRPSTSAGDFPRSVFEMLQRQLAATGRIGATRYYQFTSFGNVALGTTGNPQSCRFNMHGIALALYGAIASGLVADYGGTGLRVQIGGTEDMFIDGQGGPAFISFLALFGGVNNWQPLMRRVRPGELWLATAQNISGAANVAPSVQIGFIADADVQAMNQRR